MTFIAVAEYPYPNGEGVAENVRLAIELAMRIRGLQNITVRLADIRPSDEGEN